MKRKPQPIKIYRSTPWIIAFCALASSIANLVTGIVLLCLFKSGGDIALGILTIVFAVCGIAGSIVALVFIVRQNRYNQTKARFMAQVSHELRTPMTSIRMYADTLSLHRFKDEAEEDELIEHMNAEIGRMEYLIKQILDSKPIDNSQKVVFKTRLQDALHEVVASFCADKSNEGRLDVDIDDTVPEIAIDPRDFSHAASNLIRNALTHGGTGRVYISFNRDGNVAVLRVRDEGKGIDEAMKKKIFEPFERGDNTTDSGIPGFGLGLSIVRDFARQYGAKVEVDNAPQGGAIFTIAMKLI